MSAPRNKAFNQWKNGFIRHYEPLTSVEAFVGGWDSRDAEVAELRATNLRLIRGDFNQICSHCAWEAAAPATWEQLQAHIQECPSHPIATLKREVAALQTKLTEANLLSVTNIMLTVVPGEDGMGVEVYAKTVSDVENAFTALCTKMEDIEAKLTEAERLNKVALEAMKEAQRVSHKVVGLKLKVLNNAIKELEALK